VIGRMVRGPIADGLLLRVQYWRFEGDFRKVRRSPADSSLGACERSAWGSAELLSPLLLEFLFRFKIYCGLVLGLVCPL
jgi:hypothetical protein